MPQEAAQRNRKKTKKKKIAGDGDGVLIYISDSQAESQIEGPRLGPRPQHFLFVCILTAPVAYGSF